MITIQNYDSSRELSNYQIGDVYTFYIHNHNLNRLTEIEENDFEPFTTRLTDIIETNKDIIRNNRPYLNFTESVGIVIDTHKSTSPNELDYITVLLQTKSNDFVINKYVANHARTFL